MKLAEALIERKAIKDRLTRLRERLVENAKVQEGDTPQEDPRALLGDVDASLSELQTLTIRINATNIRTPLAEGGAVTLMEAIAERDTLLLKRAILNQLAQGTAINNNQQRVYGVTRNEVKFRPTVDVGALQKEIDALAKQYRELDTKIQAANFATELVG